MSKIFLDTSALFAGIWSAKGGARMLLKLGEARALELHVSSQVLTEIDVVLRRKAPEKLKNVALILQLSQIHISPAGTAKQVNQCEQFIDYAPDAIVLASALQANIDYFVTLDKKHFLKNELLKNSLPFLIGTPEDCLDWYRNKYF